MSSSAPYRFWPRCFTWGRLLATGWGLALAASPVLAADTLDVPRTWLVADAAGGRQDARMESLGAWNTPDAFVPGSAPPTPRRAKSGYGMGWEARRAAAAEDAEGAPAAASGAGPGAGWSARGAGGSEGSSTIGGSSAVGQGGAVTPGASAGSGLAMPGAGDPGRRPMGGIGPGGGEGVGARLRGGR